MKVVYYNTGYGGGDKRTKEQIQEKNAVSRTKRRKILFETLGNQCCKCGTCERLEVDHKNPLYKTTRQSVLSMGIDKMMAECDNLQLLCHECHKKKSTAQKKAGHYLLTQLTLEEQDTLIDKFIDV